MNVYDFDKTIYDGDSSVDFFCFELGRNVQMFLRIPQISIAFILYRMGRIKKKELKEIFFSFLKHLDDPMHEVTCFVNQNKKKIKKWYLKQMMPDDIIITASPEFLVQSFMNELLGQKCLGTKVNMYTGKIHGENCFGKEKVIRFKEKYGEKLIDDFYTDSVSDMPMVLLAKNAYLVRNDKIRIFSNNANNKGIE